MPQSLSTWVRRNPRLWGLFCALAAVLLANLLAFVLSEGLGYPTTVSDGHRTIIYPEDEELFARFLARVPAPSPLQKLLAMSLGEALALVAAWVVTG